MHKCTGCFITIEIGGNYLILMKSRTILVVIIFFFDFYQLFRKYHRNAYSSRKISLVLQITDINQLFRKWNRSAFHKGLPVYDIYRVSRDKRLLPIGRFLYAILRSSSLEKFNLVEWFSNYDSSNAIRPGPPCIHRWILKSLSTVMEREKKIIQHVEYSRIFHENVGTRGTPADREEENRVRNMK